MPRRTFAGMSIFLEAVGRTNSICRFSSRQSFTPALGVELVGPVVLETHYRTLAAPCCAVPSTAPPYYFNLLHLPIPVELSQILACPQDLGHNADMPMCGFWQFSHPLAGSCVFMPSRVSRGGEGSAARVYQLGVLNLHRTSALCIGPPDITITVHGPRSYPLPSIKFHKAVAFRSS